MTHDEFVAAIKALAEENGFGGRWHCESWAADFGSGVSVMMGPHVQLSGGRGRSEIHEFADTYEDAIAQVTAAIEKRRAA